MDDLKRFAQHCVEMIIQNDLPKQNKGQFLAWASRFFDKEIIESWEGHNQSTRPVQPADSVGKSAKMDYAKERIHHWQNVLANLIHNR